jgi:hypothetical protein
MRAGMKYSRKGKPLTPIYIYIYIYSPASADRSEGYIGNPYKNISPNPDFGILLIFSTVFEYVGLPIKN